MLLIIFFLKIKIPRIRYLHCDAQRSDINVLKSLRKNIKYLDYGVVEVSAKKMATYIKIQTITFLI